MLKVQTDFNSSVCFEISGLHSNFLVCKLQFYTVNLTVLFCKCVYSFSVFFYKIILATTAAKIIL